MHGYEIRKSLREDFGVLSNLSFGSFIRRSPVSKQLEPYPPSNLLRPRGGDDAKMPPSPSPVRSAASGRPPSPDERLAKRRRRLAQGAHELERCTKSRKEENCSSKSYSDLVTTRARIQR